MTADDDSDAAPRLALTGDARAQVVALASAVVGGLPAEDVPAGLRAIARFAPAKRQRLGAAALAAALDADDGFRAAVAETVEQTSPDLVEALRAGTVPAAAEPVDVAVVAYLIRPDGWEGLLVDATRASDAERDAGGSGELAALRAELAQLRKQARGEGARIRAAVATAVEEATVDAVAEANRLRRLLGERTRELRAAETVRDDAVAARATAHTDLAARAHELEDELGRATERLAEAERAADASRLAARRDARTERDVDDARLWLLVDTLVQAASGVRRELSLAPPSLHPADAVPSADPADREAAGVRTAADPAALDRLLALPNVHLVVDGYNVTKTGYPQLSLEEQRTRLLRGLASLVARSGVEVTVAFDGGNRPPVQPATPRGVRVLFSGTDEIADDLIRRLVAAEPAGRAVVVVTSDQAVARDTARDGAWNVPSAVVLARLS